VDLKRSVKQSPLGRCFELKRLRIIYSKRGLFSFIPHTSLPQVFARAARRAGLHFEYSEGYSPRPKISLGPALPVGVVALKEPADIHFTSWNDSLITNWIRTLPPGLDIHFWGEVEGSSLSKQCKVASYLVFPRGEISLKEFYEASTPEDMGQSLLEIDRKGDMISLSLTDPQQYGPGFLVKYLVRKEIISNWSEIGIIRTSIGNMIDGNVVPLL